MPFESKQTKKDVGSLTTEIVYTTTAPVVQDKSLICDVMRVFGKWCGGFSHLYIQLINYMHGHSLKSKEIWLVITAQKDIDYITIQPTCNVSLTNYPIDLWFLQFLFFLLMRKFFHH